MNKLIKYVVLDILRNKIVIAYTAFLFLFASGLFIMEDNPEKSLASLLTINLILIPLVSIIFSTIYVYNAAEFMELLVAQPVKRSTLWFSIYAGLAGALTLAFIIGCGVPILLYAPNAVGFSMIGMGMLLTLIFVSIALLASVYTKDKAKGVGIAILLWFYFSIVFDGVILFLLFQLMDYPIEKIVIGFSVLNPIDLARILLLLKMDVSALMGATSAVFKQVFGGAKGMVIVSVIMLLWAFVPFYFSLKRFKKKDL